ncbi:MAG: GNAT family N-acetyltransferase [Alphaproteobacteria bacterium]|nr:GNAT family N-acetyltransferase [Alphaproteobacteria bacterium]
MELTWTRETTPSWDADKQRIVGGAPEGVFEALRSSAPGTVLPGDWWRVERGGRPVAYGWMDVNWGDAEILLAVDPSENRHGLGTYVIDRLDEEAAKQGLRYLYNVVPEGHPDAHGLAGWLERRGFQTSGEGWMLRRQVRAKAS